MLAAGDPPLTYQWWVGTSPVDGATAPILAVAGARKALHQGLYSVQASFDTFLDWPGMIPGQVMVLYVIESAMSIANGFIDDTRASWCGTLMVDPIPKGSVTAGQQLRRINCLGGGAGGCRGAEHHPIIRSRLCTTAIDDIMCRSAIMPNRWCPRRCSWSARDWRSWILDRTISQRF